MDEISGLIIKMTEFFSGDPKRIQHFIKVHTFARVIGRAEGLDIRAMYCLDVASVVHDIGIKPAEERYGKGHCGGKLQEQLGPEPARNKLLLFQIPDMPVTGKDFIIITQEFLNGFSLSG